MGCGRRDRQVNSLLSFPSGWGALWRRPSPPPFPPPPCLPTFRARVSFSRRLASSACKRSRSLSSMVLCLQACSQNSSRSISTSDRRRFSLSLYSCSRCLQGTQQHITLGFLPLQGHLSNQQDLFIPWNSPSQALGHGPGLNSSCLTGGVTVPQLDGTCYEARALLSILPLGLTVGAPPGTGMRLFKKEFSSGTTLGAEELAVLHREHCVEAGLLQSLRRPLRALASRVPNSQQPKVSVSPTGVARIGPAHAQVRYRDFQICDEADDSILLKGPSEGWKRHQERGGNVLATALLASFKILLVPYTLFCAVRELRIIPQTSKVKHL